MKTLIKSCLKSIISSSTRSKLKKFKSRISHDLKKKSTRQTTLTELKQALVDLGIKKGDKLFVTSGFSNLYATYSPIDVIALLQSIVTDEGLIMMPYYPAINSEEFAKKKCVFDMQTTKSGMGVLTNIFSMMPNVYKSIHPTKAVCVWGKDAKDVIDKHYQSLDPYGANTPYGRLLVMENSKSLCLGVKNLPIFHAVEDILLPLDKLYYYSQPFDLQVKTAEGLVSCKTYVHSSKKHSKTMMGGEFVSRFTTPIYQSKKFGFSNLYCVDNNLLFEACKQEFLKGNTRTIK